MNGVRWVAMVAAVAAGGMVAIGGCGKSEPQTLKIEFPEGGPFRPSAAAEKFKADKAAFCRDQPKDKPLIHLESEEFSFDLTKTGWMVKDGKRVLIAAGVIKNVTESKQLEPASIYGHAKDEFGNVHKIKAHAEHISERLDPGEVDVVFVEIGRVLPKALRIQAALELWRSRAGVSSGDDKNPVQKWVDIDVPPFDEKTALIAPE